MKKLIIPIFIIIIITGCSKYQELNEIAIITTIGIDYKNNVYTVILKETIPIKQENKITRKYKYYTEKGSTIKKAITKIKNNSSKCIYLKQVQNIIITNNNIIDKIPNSIHKNILIFKTNNLEKVMKTNNNYSYLNALAKENKVSINNYLYNNKKDIPTISVYQNELLIKN